MRQAAARTRQTNRLTHACLAAATSVESPASQGPRAKARARGAILHDDGSACHVLHLEQNAGSSLTGTDETSVQPRRIIPPRRPNGPGRRESVLPLRNAGRCDRRLQMWLLAGCIAGTVALRLVANRQDADGSDATRPTLHHAERRDGVPRPNCVRLGEPDSPSPSPRPMSTARTSQTPGGPGASDRSPPAGRRATYIDHGEPTLAELFQAIRTVESAGDDRAVGDGGRSLGPYQCGRAAWRDACEHAGVDWDYDARVWSRPHCETIMQWYWERYGASTAEQRARTWNGGPRGAQRHSTLAYWQRVEAGLPIACRPAARRHPVRRPGRGGRP